MTMFDPKSDTLLHREERATVYLRALDGRPVYIAEPSGGRDARTLIFVHGICEHALRFLPFALDMARRGVRVVLFNLRAHGFDAAADAPHVHWFAEAYVTKGPEQIVREIQTRDAETRRKLMAINRGNVRTMAGTTMYDHFRQIEDLAEALVGGRLGRPMERGEGVLLGGHSLGGLIAANAACRLAERGPLKPAGVMLFSPALRPIAPPFLGPPGRWVVDLSWAARHNPWLAPVGVALRTVPSLPIRLKCGWASRYISDIPAHQHLHMADPLILKSVRSNYLLRIEALMARTQAQAGRYPCDVLLFAGDRDPVVNILGTRAFARSLHAHREPARCPITVFEGFYAHSPLHSTRRPEIMGRIDDWLGVISA